MATKNIRVRAVRREEVDIDKLVSALLLLIRELEADDQTTDDDAPKEPAA